MDPLISTGNLHSERMVEFLSSLSLESLPDHVILQARRCLLDSIGCGLFGAKQAWSVMMTANCIEESARGPCTLFGDATRICAAPAALVNGTAIHGFELDDLIVGAVVHPGAVVVPAALAAAEYCDAPGSRLLLGVVAGYEAMERLSIALGPDPSARGFHVTAVAGPIGAAIAAGVVMGFDVDRLLSAVGLACSTSSGIKSFAGGSGGGMVKRMHAGRSAESGVRMCQLAARGFDGPSAALDGPFGLLEVFGGASADAEQLSTRLGARWAMERIWVKQYPMCGGIHSAAQALNRLAQRHSIDPSAVAAIRVGVSRFAARNNGDQAPVDTMGAQYSIPYCAAVSLLGDPRDPMMFMEHALADSRLRELASRVTTFVDEEAEAVYPHRLSARVELVLKSGELHTDSVRDALGTPADPCGEDDRRERYFRLASAALEPEAATRVFDAVQSIDSLPSLAPLSNALRGGEA